MQTSFQEVHDLISHYLKERDREPCSSWDIAKSIVIETAELLEHYQWDEANFIKWKYNKPKDKEKIAKEVADIFIYLFQFCDLNQINPVKAIIDKLKHLEEKYPIEKVWENNSEYWKIKEKYREESND